MSKTKTAENARLDMEAGQQFYPMAQLVDSGDHLLFEHATAELFSNKEGYAPVLLPNGLATGGIVTPEVGETNDQIDTTALTCYLAGILTSVGASTGDTVTRGSTQDYLISSIQITAAGAVSVVAGTEGAASSETRGAAGGPPFILVDSIEIAQVRLTSQVAAPVAANEIFQVIGQHQERYDFPVFDEDSGSADITFITALPLSHTGIVAKRVFSEVYEPIFAQISLAADFVAPENSHSVASTQIYGTTIGSVSSSLGQGSFSAYLKDGVEDTIVKEKDNTLWFKFWPDRFKVPHILAQGKLGISRSFPAGDSIIAACTISSQAAAIEKLTA